MDISLFPLDHRCRLLSNLLWTRDRHGYPTLGQQHLWVRFPSPITVLGCRFAATTELGVVRFETSPDEGETWQTIAQVTTHAATADARRMEGGDSMALITVQPEERAGMATFTCRWPAQEVENLRVVVAEAENPLFPLSDYFTRLELLCVPDEADAETRTGNTPPGTGTTFIPLQVGTLCPWQPAAGDPTQNIYDRLGHCHRSTETNRVAVVADADEITLTSPVLRLGFSRHFALLRHLGWDLGGNNRQGDNLLSTANTQGAFPVVLRGMERRASDVGGGRLEANGRTVAYRDVSVVPELKQSLVFSVREDGFRLELAWECTQTFRTAEYAALRLPLDLYQSVMSVLALPNTSGPSGLVDLPLVLHAPNHGSLRVTVVENASGHPVVARVSPFRVQAELWLDLIVGARPLPNGLFEVPAGQGRVVLDLQLTKIFPFGTDAPPRPITPATRPGDVFHWWQRPPAYSFVDRERILGALPNEWLSGLGWRPELARFANNSVAESATGNATFYAEIAAFTPDLAPGLPATALLKCGTDTILLDTGLAPMSDYIRFPTVTSALLDCAWLTVAATGDWTWAAQRRNEIVQRGEYLLRHEFRDTGLVACSYSGAAREQGAFMSASWFDSLRSGHLESFNNAHVYRALLRAAELLARLNERNLAAALRAMAARARAHFMSTFFDTQTRRMAQWVDVDGVRYGFDSHTHLSAPIVCGLIPAPLARELLLEYLQRMQRRHLDYRYGLPITLDPVPAHLHNAWMGKGVEADGSDALGIYMDGALTHHHAYLTLQALYQVGLRHQANDLFIKLTPLARSGGLSAGLHSGVDWRQEDGSPSGYEGLLAEQFQFLLAAVTGYMGWELTLDGLRLNPSVRAACSGRVHNVKPNFARLAQPA